MDTTRKLAIAAGICYLITHVTSVAAPFLYGPILSRTDYVLGSGAATRGVVGAFLEIILAMGIIGTAVALFPVVKWWGEGVALGYVGLRTLEAAIIAVGVLPLLAVVTLRAHLAGAAGTDAAALLALGQALVAVHTWTLILGPGMVCGVNTVLLASLMFSSRLVPRVIPVLGLVGGPLVFVYNAALLFGLSAHIPAWAGLLVIPIFAWEVSLALWLIIKGFRPAALASRPARPAAPELVGAASGAA